MNINLEFDEGEQTFPLDFGEVQFVDDGGYDAGYENGYTEGVASVPDYLEQKITGTLTEYTNDKVTSIGRYAFYGSTIKKVNFPAAITSDDGWCHACNSLTEVNVPKLETVAQYSFFQGYSLLFLDLPSAKSIAHNAFARCTKLETVILRANTICTLSNTNALTNTPIASGTGYIYVPKALIESYKTATNWSAYAAQFRAIEDYPEITGG